AASPPTTPTTPIDELSARRVRRRRAWPSLAAAAVLAVIIAAFAVIGPSRSVTVRATTNQTVVRFTGTGGSLAMAYEPGRLDAVLMRTARRPVELTDARYGALSVLGVDGSIEEFITQGVTPEERARIGDPPTGHGILGVIIGEGRPLRLPDIGADPRSVGFP